MTIVFNFTFVLSTERIPEEGYSPSTKRFVEEYKKMSAPGPETKYWLGFSYIC